MVQSTKISKPPEKSYIQHLIEENQKLSKKLKAFQNADLIERPDAISAIENEYGDDEWQENANICKSILNELPRFNPEKGDSE